MVSSCLFNRIGGNLDWRPIVAGDFNHDNTDDIIWHSSGSGVDLMWTMVNGQPTVTQTIGGDTNSQPVATGDFNHDGYADIVWRTGSTGADLLWSMGVGTHPAITADQFTIA